MRTIGIHEDWTASPAGRTPTQVRARYPKSGVGRPFVTKPSSIVDLRPKALAALQPYLDAGTKVIYVSFKTDPTQTSNGDWNARYQELGVYLAQLQVQYGLEIVVVAWHEPEDDFASGAAFVTYFNKVYDAIKLGSTAVKVKPCFMSYHWAPNSGGTASIGGKTNTPSAWFTNLKMNDGVTVDVYSGRSFPLEQILTEHPGFARWVANLPAGIDINLTERGFETPSSTYPTNRSALRASTMRREFDWLLSSDPIALRIKDYIVWSSPGTENAPGLIMDAAAESEIDRFLASPSLTIPKTPQAGVAVPDKSHIQYQFGFDAGNAAGRAQGRASTFTEIRNWLASQS